MKRLDRLLLTVLCAVTVVLALLLTAAAVGLPFGAAWLKSALDTPESGSKALIMCLVALALLLIAVRLLFSAYRGNAEPSTVPVAGDPNSGVFVSMDSIRSAADRCVRAELPVTYVKTDAAASENAVRLTVRIGVGSDATVPELAARLREKLTENIETCLGVSVESATVIVNSVGKKSASAPAAPAPRVN